MSEHFSASVEETRDENSFSRRNFLGLAAAGAVAGTAALALGASSAHADVLRSVRGVVYLDPLVVNFAFELEELQKDFFQRVTLSRAFDDLSPREQNAFALIAREDAEHFGELKKFRDRKAYKGAGHFETPNASGSRRPGIFTFPSRAFKTREALYETAFDIKETGLLAYHGAVDLVANDTLLLAAAIAGVEGRHLTILRELRGLDPVPLPFESALTPDAAGRRLAKYNFNGGGYGIKGGRR